VLLKDTVYRQESFPSKESDTKDLTEHIFRLRNRHHHHHLSFKYNVTERLLKAAQRMLGSCNAALSTVLRTIVQQATPRLTATMSQP